MEKKYVADKLNRLFSFIESDSFITKVKEYIIFCVLLSKFCILLLLLLQVNIVKGQVLISQYIETITGSSPKGIEIYNSSNSPIIFSNVNNLQVSQGTNGGTCSLLPGTNITSGTLLAGEVWVIGSSELTTYAQSNAINLSGFTNYNFDFNGNDALVLSLGGVVNDVFGTCGNDPGTSWSGSGVSTDNQNIQIKSSIVSGTSIYWIDPSLRFETVSSSNQMTGFGTAPSFSTLPVELTSFSSICNENNTVSLEWTTASEHNASHFEVEKSRDGENWTLVKMIPAIGNSTQLTTYQCLDEITTTSTSYYRLIQTDVNGAVKKYDIISANCKQELGFSVELYPNPSNGEYTIQLNNPSKGNYQIEILSITGQLIQRAFNTVTSSETTVIKSSDSLNKGTYFVRLLIDEVLMETTKLMVE